MVLTIYILGVFFAILDFTEEVRTAEGNPMGLSYLDAFVYVIQTTDHYKYTLRSWLYFLNI